MIIDMAMPDMNGEATIRALLQINPEQKIIASSGLTNAQEGKNEEPGIKEFLPKPFTSEKLLSVIEKVLADKL